MTEGKVNIPHGAIVKDIVSGYQGVVIGKTTWTNGCVHVIIQAQGLTKDGDPISPRSFDEIDVQIVDEKPAITEKMRAHAATSGSGGRVPSGRY